MNGSKLRQIWVILTEREVSIRKNDKSSQPPSDSQSLVDPSKQTVGVLREGLYPHTVPSSIPSPDGHKGAEAVESEGNNGVQDNSSVQLTTRAGGAAATPRRGRDGITSRGDDAHCVQIREQTSNELPNLWIKALVSLRRDGDRNTRQVIERYFDILNSELRRLGTGGPRLDHSSIDQAEVALLLKKKTEELDKQKLTMKWKSHEVQVAEVFNSAVKHIIAAKDLITAAAGASPHASIACAGGLVLLTLLIRPAEQKETLIEGMRLISSIIVRHTAFDPRDHIGEHPSSNVELREDLEDNLVRLYAKVIEFQARALRHLCRNSFKRFICDIFRDNTWTRLMSEITQLDTRSREPGRDALFDRINRHMDYNVVAQLNEAAAHKRDQRSNLINLLRVCPYEDQKYLVNDRAPGTCEWILKKEEFQIWSQEPEARLLWVTAYPGCGKSVLAKHLVNNILPDRSKRTVCYFFFKEGNGHQMKAKIAMCSILHQLLKAHPDLADETLLKTLSDPSERDTLRNSVWQLFRVLTRLSSVHRGEIVCVLDALDECEDSQDLVSEITKFYQRGERQSKLKLLVASRPNSNIQNYVLPQEQEESSSILILRCEDEDNAKLIAKEIKTFIRWIAPRTAAALRLRPEEAKLLKKTLFDADNGTYLWIPVILEDIKKSVTSGRQPFKDALQNTPMGLDEAYDRMLCRTKNEHLTRKILHIALAAQRPLTIEEMSVAASIKEFGKEYSKIDNSAQEQFEIILGNTCGLFLIVKRGRISFLHQTGREFLIRRQDQLVPQTSTVSRNPSWKGQFDLQESHALMVRICASYLLLYKPQDDGEGTKRLSVRTFEEDLQESEYQGSGISGSWDFPSSDHEDYDVPEEAGLEKYATSFWARHCIMADLERHHYLIDLAARLCFFENGGKLGLFTALSLRLSAVVSRMAEISPAAMCEKTEGGRTVLMVAVTSRDVEFIRALLEAKHGDPAINDGDPYLNRTPLVSAVLDDFPELVELLLEDPRTQPYLKTSATTFEAENSFWTAFQFSVWHGKEATNCFLQHKTFLKNMPEDHREGLLLWLFQNRFLNHIRAVARDGESQRNDSENSPELALLAVRDLEPISQQTPEAQRRIFLDTLSHLSTLSPMDVDVDHRTAVWYAASSNKHIKLLDYLVFGLGLPPDTPDRYGVTPLFNAAVNRATVSIEYLLKMSSLYKPEEILSGSLQENQNDVPHPANSRWQAHDPIIARPFIPQIAVGTVVVNCQDNRGRTPLLKSIWRPVMESIKPFKTVLLLLHHGADPNIRDNNGQTALMKAAKKGYIHVASCLIKHCAVVNMKDFRGRTALHQAIEKGCVGVAALLLEAGADYRSPTNRGKTPYDYAKKVFPHSKGVKRTRIEKRIDSRRLRIARMMEALMDVEEGLHQERGQQTSSGETTNDKIAQERRHD